MIPATTPMCDVARSIPEFKQRLKHYRTCSDPRCQARAKAATELGAAIAADLKKQKSRCNMPIPLEKYVEQQWQGKPVRQVQALDALDLGRTGIVQETFWDETGALHCRVLGRVEFWCPARKLEIVKQ